MRRSDPRLLVALAVTGMAALALEVVWSRALIPWVGGTAMAQVMTVAVYMFGLFLGAAWGVRLNRRVADPRRTFLVLEACGAGISVLAILGLPAMSWLFALCSQGPLLSGTTGAALRGLAGGLLILPGTLCMGAAFPIAIDALQRRRGGRDTASIVYGVNTLGATLGTCLGGFLLIPRLGVLHSTWLVLVADWLVLWWASRAAPAEQAAPSTSEGEPAPAGMTPGEGPMHVAVFLGGVVALGLEVLLFRLLGMVLGPTARAFTIVLVSYVLGLGLGSLLAGRLVGRSRRVAFATFLGCWLFVGAAGLVGHTALAVSPEWLLMQHTEEVSLAGRLVQRAWTAGLILVPMTLAFGASYAAAVAAGGLGEAARAGRLYASLTLGNIVGLVVGAFVLLPTYGVEKSVLLLYSLAFLTPVPLLFTAAARSRGVRVVLAVCVVAAALPWVFGRSWNWKALNSAPYLTERTEAERNRDVLRELRFLEHGFETTVAVVQEGDGRYFTLDGKPDGSNLFEDQETQSFTGVLPVALHPAPRSALVVGLGTGQTCADLLRFPVELVECAELSQAVVRMLPFFDDINGGLRESGRFHVLETDARTVLRYGRKEYDLIVSEPSNLWVPGVAHLFTRETFEEARERLAPGGYLVQWLHAYSLDPEAFRTVVRTLLEVFPHVSLWSTTMQAEEALFLCSVEPVRVEWDALQARLTAAAVPDPAAPGTLFDASTVLRRYVAGTDSLRRFAGDGPVTRDSRPTLEYLAETSMLEAVGGRFHRVVVELLETPPEILTAPDPATVKLLKARAEGTRAMHRFWTETAPDLDALLRVARRHPDDRELAQAVANRLVDASGKDNAAGQTDRAWSSVNAALELVPGHTSALQRKYAMQLARRQFSDAHRTLDRLAETYGRPGIQPLLLRAHLLRTEGRLDEMATVLGQARDARPASVEVLLNLADCEFRRGDATRARDTVQQALELDPFNEMAREIERVLDSR